MIKKVTLERENGTIVKVRMGFPENADWIGLLLCNYFMHTKRNVCKFGNGKSSGL